MRFISKLIDFATIGSQSPVRRLIAYYVVLVALTTALVTLVPRTGVMFSGERLEELTSTPRVLEDGLNLDQFSSPTLEIPDRVNLIIVTATMMLGTILLMLPVTWVYMSAWKVRGYSQSVVQTLLILPIVVSGIVLIVRNSLALAFSLAGIVAGVRFRNTLKDPRDAVFIFLAIGVGLAAGVQAPTVGFLVSMVFNFTLLIIWRTNFGRSVLEPRPSATWTEPLSALAAADGDSSVPDRDLVLSLTREETNELADRFNRLRKVVGSGGKQKSRYDAVLWMTTEDITAVQKAAEDVLEDTTKRWRLDEVVTNESKPSELYYLVRLRAKVPADEVITAIRSRAGDRIIDMEVILSDALSHA